MPTPSTGYSGLEILTQSNRSDKKSMGETVLNQSMTTFSVQKLAPGGTDGRLLLWASLARLERHISIFVQVQSHDTKTRRDIKNRTRESNPRPFDHKSVTLTIMPPSTTSPRKSTPSTPTPSPTFSTPSPTTIVFSYFRLGQLPQKWTFVNCCGRT